MKERKCICCEKVLLQEEHLDGDRQFGSSIGIVYDATIWRSRGNYGSGIYDSMGIHGKDVFIEAYICDECLKKKKDLVYHVSVSKKETTEVKTFDPGDC